MAFACFLRAWSPKWRTPHVVAALALSVMLQSCSGPALDFWAVFGDTSLDDIHREPAEDDIWRAETHPDATGSGPGDGADLQPPEPQRVGTHGVRAPRLDAPPRHVEGPVLLELAGYARRPRRHHPATQASDEGSGAARADVPRASRLPAGRGSPRLGDAECTPAGDDASGPSALEGLPADLPLPGGYRHPFGAHLGYLIVSEPRQQELGGFVFAASAAWALAPRDQWIGWDTTHRQTLLSLVLSNDRFVIFPWVTVPNLASHVLSLATTHIADDWGSLHGYRPVLIETFVVPHTNVCTIQPKQVGRAVGRGCGCARAG